jgi:hypothetical protein
VRSGGLVQETKINLTADNGRLFFNKETLVVVGNLVETIAVNITS